MSESNIERLREMQRKIETDAQGVTTYWDLRRLRAYWGDLQIIIDNETENQ